MPVFSTEITLSGVILILGQISLFVAFVWKRSTIETEQRAKVDANATKIAQLEVELDSKASTLSAAITLTRDQHHELREHLATNYMKREEIAAMERRITDSQTALRSDINNLNNKIDTKIDALQKTVLDAIASLKIGSRG